MPVAMVANNIIATDNVYQTNILPHWCKYFEQTQREVSAILHIIVETNSMCTEMKKCDHPYTMWMQLIGIARAPSYQMSPKLENIGLDHITISLSNLDMYLQNHGPTYGEKIGNPRSQMHKWKNNQSQSRKHPAEYPIMMTSSDGNILRVTGPVCGEFSGHRWIPLTKASDADLWCFLWFAPKQTAEKTIDTLVIWNANALIMTSL